MPALTGSRPAPASDPSLPVILSLAFPFAVVGEGAVGGAEVVLSQLESALPSLGFRSVVVARQGSQPAGVLYVTPVASGEIGDDQRAKVEAAHQANLDRALAEHPVALLHMHGLDFHRYRVPPGLPVLVTLHLPPDWYPESIWQLPPNYHLVCVSETQRGACPAFARERIEVIGNGVPLPERATLRPGGRYALMLSRICPEKNLHMGFDAARLAGLPALLAGEVFTYRDHLRYFAESIEPRLTAPGTDHMQRPRDKATSPNAASPHHARPDARFLGPVTGAAKARLLSRAACLLLPSLAPETSSLVAMEAMAAGVPVIAVASGAVPEIVDGGRTGLLVSPAGDIVGDLAAALRQVASLDRSLCRRTAETRFSLERMLDAYASLYRRLALRSPAPPSRGSIDRLAISPVKPDTETPGGTVANTPGEAISSLHTGVAALAAMGAEWSALWHADGTATPFQHPAWLLPWARQFGPDGLVQAVAQRDADGRLVGLLPLFTLLEPGPRSQLQSLSQTESQSRKLLLLGTGTTDYLGGVFHPTDATRLAAAALQFARQEFARQNFAQPQSALLIQPAPHRIDLLQLREDSPLLTAVAALPGWERAPAEACAVLPLSRPLPAKLATNLGRYRRLAARTGALSTTLAATPAQALESFDLLARLHTQRWQARDEEGVLHDSRVLAHHREALRALLAAGLLRLFRLTLEIDGIDGANRTNGPDTLAVLYALADPRNGRSVGCTSTSSGSTCAGARSVRAAFSCRRSGTTRGARVSRTSICCAVARPTRASGEPSPKAPPPFTTSTMRG